MPSGSQGERCDRAVKGHRGLLIANCEPAVKEFGLEGKRPSQPRAPGALVTAPLSRRPRLGPIFNNVVLPRRPSSFADASWREAHAEGLQFPQAATLTMPLVRPERLG
ncbi:MAG: hypothetical protein AUI36_42700 [Cyanobacteria bacterium 13_1_40CM_2_61_4]|nr:MAG: hypothetical protein AUI36_42700 [Cyanobacteria bacterium 13_1_40CM_2_61_4]